MRNARGSPAPLLRRLAALEKSLSVGDKAHGATIQRALDSISADHLEPLIDATLAPRQGRELTEREAEAQQTYAAALDSESGRGGWTVRRKPDVPHWIVLAALRRESEDDMLLFISGARAMEQGREPSVAEVAAMEVCAATLEAQYQRAGFSSQAEFERWYGEETFGYQAGGRDNACKLPRAKPYLLGVRPRYAGRMTCQSHQLAGSSPYVITMESIQPASGRRYIFTPSNTNSFRQYIGQK